MKAWVFLCYDSPLEHWMEGFDERFDAWEKGGVTGLVVGTSMRAIWSLAVASWISFS